jgi:type VI secretion system secreted protein Hcp
MYGGIPAGHLDTSLAVDLGEHASVKGVSRMLQKRWAYIAVALGTMALGALLVAIGTASAAYEFYMKIEGIKGESTQAGHQQWISFASYNHHIPGLPQPQSLLKHTMGITHGTHSDGDIVFTKSFDKVSPRLVQTCASGTHLPLLKFEMCGQGGTGPVYLTFVMHDCIITSLTLRAPGFGDRNTPFGPLPLKSSLEEITIHYSQLEWTYTPPEGTAHKD